MPLGKTEFLPGVFLKYPLGSLPQLFSVLDTVSRKAFFEKIAQLDGQGGEGLSIEQYVKIIHVGLLAENPGTTYEDALKLVEKYNEEHGQQELESLIIDAFGDAKLSDKEVTDKRKALLKDIKDLELRRLEYAVHAKTQELEEAEAKIIEKVGELGNRKPAPVKPSHQRQKKT